MNTIWSLFAIIILFTNFDYSRATNYENYTMYNMFLESARDYEFVMDLYNRNLYDVIFAEMPPENKIVQILVSRNKESSFVDKVNYLNIRAEKLGNNAQELFDQLLTKGFYRRVFTKPTILPLAEIYKWLNETAEKYPYTKLESFGRSAEDRDIYVFSIKIPPRPNYSNVKAVIEGAVHGNEWIAVYSVLRMIELILISSYGPYQELKNRFYLYFIPVLNPDGYEYSLNHDPLWKKNRRKIDDDVYGVNLNRNFPYKFGEYDSSENPMSDKYRGPYPFSEPETMALKEFIYRKRGHMMFYFSIHGHGQKFILPYADSTKHVVNFHEVQHVANKAITRMKDNSDRDYDVGVASEILGKQYSGDSASWVKKDYHVKFTMTIQLRDKGEEGILMRTEEYENAGDEIAEGLTTLMLASGRYRSYENVAALRNKVYTSVIILLISLLILN